MRPGLDLEIKTRLALGRIVDGSLRIGPGLVERAISVATGSTPKKLKELLLDYGEHGEVAYLLLKGREPRLTVEEVYESIRLLPWLKKVRERDHLLIKVLYMMGIYQILYA